jgi:hypothetical protein
MDWTRITPMRALRIALLAVPLAAGAVGMACGQTNTKQQQEPPTKSVAQGVHLLNIFEIDNNTPNAAAAGDDWQNTIGEAAQGGTKTSAAIQYVRIGDGAGGTGTADNSTIFTGGGSKDEQPIANWKWKDGAGGLPDKDNIVNAYAAAYINSANGHLILYFGADRFDTSGDAQMGFWFFRDNVARDPTDGTFNGEHLDGDLLVLVNFLKGGTENHIQVFKWQSGAVVQVTNDVFSNGTPLCNPAQGALAADVACGSTNRDATTTAYWPYEAKGVGATTTIPKLGFVEGGIDATALSGITCVSSFLAETRSSQSITATLKDFALGSFPTCGLNVTKSCAGTTLTVLDAGVDAPGIVAPLINVGGQVCNSGVGQLTNVTVTDNIPGKDPIVMNLGTLNGGQCANYDAGYVPSLVDDGGTNPCSALFSDTVTVTGNAGATVVEAGPATASCPLCPCTTGGGDAGTD